VPVRTNRYGDTIPPRAELLPSKASVVCTGVSALAELESRDRADLSAIEVSAFSIASHAPRQIRRPFFVRVLEVEV
jgi:hypothetical protein